MLKASYEVLDNPNGNSFLFKVFDELAFTAPYHFHPEYELTLITGGRGKRYVGNHMSDFMPGDLVLIGPHLPHCWKLEVSGSHVAGGAGIGSGPGAIVIQFAPDFLGKDIFSKTEFGFIHKLLQQSGCGIQFPPARPLPSPVRGEAMVPAAVTGRGEAMVRAAATSGAGAAGRAEATAHAELRPTPEDRILALAAEKNDFRKLMGLLELLQELALNRDAIRLDTRRTAAVLPPVDRERLHPIFAYLVDNFRGDISLDNAAAAIGMTPNAFCRYFKKITRKTFMETVIEYRLNYATQQLVQTDKPVSAICFDSGFGDISHFYKMFRSRMQLSPLHYRKQFRQETTKK